VLVSGSCISSERTGTTAGRAGTYILMTEITYKRLKRFLKLVFLMTLEVCLIILFYVLIKDLWFGSHTFACYSSQFI